MSEPIRYEAEGIAFTGEGVAALLRRAADWLVSHPGYFLKAVSVTRDEFGDRVELYGWEK